METLLLRNGTVVTSNATLEADVFVADGAIAAIGRNLPHSADRVQDVAGRYLLPGGVDVHTHLDAPVGQTSTSDDFATGTIAAACGGTTTIVDFAFQMKGQRLTDSLSTWKGKAASKAVIDYGFHVAVSHLYDGMTSDLEDIIVDGVTSLKIFMAFRGMFMLNDGEILEVLRVSSTRGAQVCVHAENGDVIDRLASDLVASGRTDPRSHPLSRPASTEVEAVQRAIQISRVADAPIYFVHLSTEGAAEEVAAARQRDWPVAGETCTHYLTLGPELYDRADFEGAKAVMAPPLRDAAHRDALWKSLRTGGLGIVSSDHCPFCFKGQKDLGRNDFRLIPNGAPGIEDRLIVMYGRGVAQGELTLQQFVSVTAANPAKAFGLYPKKGDINVGADADIVVLDPKGATHISASTQKQNIDYNLWEGWSLPGRIDDVYSRGEKIVDNGKFVGAAGRGRFLPRSRVS